jgi:hypothetical protein
MAAVSLFGRDLGYDVYQRMAFCLEPTAFQTGGIAAGAEQFVFYGECTAVVALEALGVLGCEEHGSVREALAAAACHLGRPARLTRTRLARPRRPDLRESRTSPPVAIATPSPIDGDGSSLRSRRVLMTFNAADGRSSMAEPTPSDIKHSVKSNPQPELKTGQFSPIMHGRSGHFSHLGTIVSNTPGD